MSQLPHAFLPPYYRVHAPHHNNTHFHPHFQKAIVSILTNLHHDCHAFLQSIVLGEWEGKKEDQEAWNGESTHSRGLWLRQTISGSGFGVYYACVHASNPYPVMHA
jgi:hypothetical protein